MNNNNFSLLALYVLRSYVWYSMIIYSINRNTRKTQNKKEYLQIWKSVEVSKKCGRSSFFVSLYINIVAFVKRFTVLDNINNIKYIYIYIYNIYCISYRFRVSSLKISRSCRTNNFRDKPRFLLSLFFLFLIFIIEIIFKKNTRLHYSQTENTNTSSSICALVILCNRNFFIFLLFYLFFLFFFFFLKY